MLSIVLCIILCRDDALTRAFLRALSSLTSRKINGARVVLLKELTNAFYKECGFTNLPLFLRYLSQVKYHEYSPLSLLTCFLVRRFEQVHKGLPFCPFEIASSREPCFCAQSNRSGWTKRHQDKNWTEILRDPEELLGVGTSMTVNPASSNSNSALDKDLRSPQCVSLSLLEFISEDIHDLRGHLLPLPAAVRYLLQCLLESRNDPLVFPQNDWTVFDTGPLAAAFYRRIGCKDNRLFRLALDQVSINFTFAHSIAVYQKSNQPQGISTKVIERLDSGNVLKFLSCGVRREQEEPRNEHLPANPLQDPDPYVFSFRFTMHIWNP